MSVALASVASATALPPEHDASTTAKALRTGSLSTRQEALAFVRDSSSLIKDPTVIAAIKDEFVRYTGDERQWLKAVQIARQRGQPPPAPISSELRSSEYKHALEALMIDSKDPVFIPQLTWAVGSNGKAVDALAAFGELAFLDVLARYDDMCVASLDCPKSLRYGLLLTMARMVDSASLNRPNEARVVAVARQALLSDDWELIGGAINIVAASCDDGLRQLLSNITSGPRRLSGVPVPQAEGLIARGNTALQGCLESRRSRRLP